MFLRPRGATRQCWAWTAVRWQSSTSSGAVDNKGSDDLMKAAKDQAATKRETSQPAWRYQQYDADRKTPPRRLAAGARQRDDRPPGRGPYVERPEIPFARPLDQQLPSQQGLSRAERRAFTRLGGLNPPTTDAGLMVSMPTTVPSRSARKRKLHKPRSQIDAILDAMSLEESQCKHTIALQQRVGKVTKIEGLAQSELPDFNEITSRLEAATTDFVIWNILTDELFPAVSISDLHDRGTGSDSTVSSRLDLISRHLPEVLSLAARLLRIKFPASNILPAIISELRRLGPAVYALGATTELYNEVLDHFVEQEEDIAGVSELLDEMDRDVIEPNQRTVDILDAFRSKVSKVRRGLYGPAANALWTTERNRLVTRLIADRAATFQRLVNEKRVSMETRIES